ncbi:MAG: HEAT repeat domain-containing protein [Thermodesulfobacteriota bacterium]|nr:HEAT repeat domain-containing protein [Thermodesulfobacteriota bacterium]
MGNLSDFLNKDMIEQITILDEIKSAGQTDVIPELSDLLAYPTGDQAVDEMIYHTLFDMLDGQDDRVIAGLNHESDKVRLLCIRRAGENAPASALQVLLDMLETNRDDDDLVCEIIRALGNFKDPALVDSIMPFLESKNATVAAWAMQSLMELDASKVLPALKNFITKRDDYLRKSGECDLQTASAIQNIASFTDEDSMAFLVSRIHHPNPMFRKCVLTAMASIGKAVLPALENCLKSGNKDERIMVANVIGVMGEKTGADVLISTLDQDLDIELNLKFSIYDALGKISSMRSIIALSDGLEEKDELVLMAVVTGLESLFNPAVIKKVNEVLDRGDEQSARLVTALIAARAIKLFKCVFDSDTHAETMIKSLLATQDKYTVLFFRVALEKMKEERSTVYAKRLQVENCSIEAGRILFVDDSKAMLYFYKSVAAELEVWAETAEDGRIALKYLQSGESVDLLVTDLNMPNMDGIELVKEIRRSGDWAGLYILMATTETEEFQTGLATEAGVNEFIAKPFTKEAFKENLQKCLERTRE